jgi:hypothetical protein
MSKPFERESSEHSLGLSDTLVAHQQHMERIQSKLKEFLFAQEARETAIRVYTLAVDIDQEIGRILRDPLARQLYDYDGQFFISRSTRWFHTAFDGLHLLEWLSGSTLATFFRGREKHSAIRWLLEELRKHAWVAKRRRMNWEESHTLGLVPKEVLEAIINGAWARGTEVGALLPPLSLEEQTFFRFFEEQMAEGGGTPA